MRILDNRRRCYPWGTVRITERELKEYNGVQRSSVGSQNSSSGVSSRKKMSASDSDLWTVVTSCIKAQYIRSSNPKPVLLVTQTPDTWQYTRNSMGQSLTEADFYSACHINFISDMLWNVSQLRVTILRIEKLVAEAGDTSGTQKKRNVRHWKPLQSNG
jgi:hypothetical protein